MIEIVVGLFAGFAIGAITISLWWRDKTIQMEDYYLKQVDLLHKSNEELERELRRQALRRGDVTG